MLSYVDMVGCVLNGRDPEVFTVKQHFKVGHDTPGFRGLCAQNSGCLVS